MNLVLNTPLNTIANLFPDVSKLKLMAFWIFLTINFSYQYLPEARTCLKPSRTSTMELFREKYFFFSKFARKNLCQSLFLIKLQVTILQLHWKKGLLHRCFLMNFARYLRQRFYRTPPGDCFCFNEKYFTKKVEKNHLRKEKKWKQVVRKTTTHGEQKLNHYLHQVLISFFYSSNFFFSLFSASHDILKTRVFRNNAIPLRIYLLQKIISHLQFQ